MNSVNDNSASWTEQLSALHDGQLIPEQAQALVRASLQDDAILMQWRSMSVISHSMRDMGSLPLLNEFKQNSAVVAPVAGRAEAANDGVFRWKMVAGVAALAAVGSLVWGLLGVSGDPGGRSEGVLAQKPVDAGVSLVSTSSPALGGGSAEQANAEPGKMIRDPRLDELLAAHRQFGGVSALQQPAGSLRSVSLVSPRP